MWEVLYSWIIKFEVSFYLNYKIKWSTVRKEQGMTINPNFPSSFANMTRVSEIFSIPYVLNRICNSYVKYDFTKYSHTSRSRLFAYVWNTTISLMDFFCYLFLLIWFMNGFCHSRQREIESDIHAFRFNKVTPPSRRSSFYHFHIAVS